MVGGSWRVVCLVVTSSALWSATAHAEPPSPRVAAALSVTPTLLGLGLGVSGIIVANTERACENPGVGCGDYFEQGLWMAIAGGALLTVGPSLGHVYAGRLWSTGLKVRLVGLGLGAVGMTMLAIDTDCGQFVCTHQGIGALIAIGAGATVVVGAGIDAARASDAAAAAAGPQLTIAPLRTQTTTVPALVLTGQF